MKNIAKEFRKHIGNGAVQSEQDIRLWTTAYCRVSTELEEQEGSYEMQI